MDGELYGDIDSYISENYVEEKELEEYPSDLLAPVYRGSPKLGGAAASFLGRSSGKASRAFSTDEEVAEDAFHAEMASCAMAERSLDDVVNDLDKTFMELVFSTNRAGSKAYPRADKGEEGRISRHTCLC